MLNYFSVGCFRLPPPPTPDKYSYETDRSFAYPVTVHTLDPSIESSRTKEVVFVFMLQSEVTLWI